MHYLAMELVAGDTLRPLIGTRRFDSKRTPDLFVQVADAWLRRTPRASCIAISSQRP